VGTSETVVFDDARRGTHAEAFGVVQQATNACRARRTNPHGGANIFSSEFVEPLRHWRSVEPELRQYHGTHIVLGQVVDLAAQFAREHLFRDIRVALRVASDRYVFDAELWEYSGLQHLQR